MGPVGWFWLTPRPPWIEQSGSDGRSRNADRGRGLTAWWRRGPSGAGAKWAPLMPSLLYTLQRVSSALLVVALARVLLFFLSPHSRSIFREPALLKQSGSH